jgi:glycogen debranching enzyme
LADSAGAVTAEYDIEPEAPFIDRSSRSLKDGDAFTVVDSGGDFGTVAGTSEGLFYRDTRFLSYFELRLEGQPLVVLGSTAHDDKAALSVDLTNAELPLGSESVPRETIFVERTKFLWRAAFYERLKVHNFSSVHRRLRFDYRFDADFRDLFEVRGMARQKRGLVSAHRITGNITEFKYRGLDGIGRRTSIIIGPAPDILETNGASLYVELAPGGEASVFVTIACEVSTGSGFGDSPPQVMEFLRAYRMSRRERRVRTSDIATVESSNELFNEVVCRAASDVYSLVTSTALGPYPFAGIPWFSTVFGRDGIFTAMFMLWVDPSLARGVLRTLAATQATQIDAASDAQPGKILHELRQGEMANLGEVPFKRYYGSVDSTPLFVMLAGMYLDATGDVDTITAIWPNILAALRWIDEYGDRDNDGFVEYWPESSGSLANQGWKDSHDSVFHADGANAAGPIALCEVQGYVFAAKLLASRMAESFGSHDLGVRLSTAAEKLRSRFEGCFWDEEMGTYVLALDGAKRPCRVRASNAGHALFTGIASPDRARRVARVLMSRNGFSGWGVRTLNVGEPRYNPMSYHNGSVWPHDNAVIAIGFARYGMKAEATRVFEALFDAAQSQELRRLPELFCGFLRRPRRGPTPYPVACSPQAWAASAIYGVLGACLGLEQAHAHNEIRFREPMMPAFMDEVVLRNMRLDRSRADLQLHRYGDDVAMTVLARKGTAKFMVLK